MEDNVLEILFEKREDEGAFNFEFNDWNKLFNTYIPNNRT